MGDSPFLGGQGEAGVPTFTQPRNSTHSHCSVKSHDSLSAKNFGQLPILINTGVGLPPASVLDGQSLMHDSIHIMVEQDANTSSPSLPPSSFTRGDKVILLKEGSMKGHPAVVLDPAWNGLVKFEMEGGPHSGQTKSYVDEHLQLMSAWNDPRTRSQRQAPPSRCHLRAHLKVKTVSPEQQQSGTRRDFGMYKL